MWFTTFHLPPPPNSVSSGVCRDLNVRSPLEWKAEPCGGRILLLDHNYSHLKDHSPRFGNPRDFLRYPGPFPIGVRQFTPTIMLVESKKGSKGERMGVIVAHRRYQPVIVRVTLLSRSLACKYTPSLYNQKNGLRHGPD